MTMDCAPVPEQSIPKLTKARIIKNLLLISLAFFLLFTAYDGLSMLQSTMNKKEGIGVISQAAAYISFCISALLLPKYVIKKLGCKSTLIVSIIFYLPGIAANFYPTWYLMIPSAVLGGVGASILWGSQCTYFNESAVRYARLITNGTLKRDDQTSEIPSVSTSVETLSVRTSVCEIIEENPLQDGLSIKFSSEDGAMRYKCNNISYGNADEIELKSIKYMKNTIYNSNTINTTEQSRFDQLENSRSTDISPTIVKSHEIQGEGDSKDLQNRDKISNEDIFKSVADVSGLINRGVSKLQEESVSPKRNPNSQPVFQRANTLENVTGFFFGCHGIAYYSAQICSNAISYFVLKGNDEQIVSYSDGCSCGSQFCFDNPSCVNEDTEYVSDNIRYLLTGISVVIGIIGVLLVVLFVDPLQKAKSEDEPEKISLRLVAATISHNKKKEQLCLIPMSFFEGMQQGFYTADFTMSYVGCAWGASNVGLVSVFYGTACVASSLASGFLVKYAGRTTLFFIGQVISILMMIFLTLWVPDSATPYKFYIAAIFFGTITGIYWSQLLSFYGLLFKKDEEAAFASYYLWSSLGWTTSFLYSDHLCTYVKLYLLTTVSIMGTTGYLYTERAYRLRKL